MEIPSQPTARQLMDIVKDLNWQWEGKTPLLIYEKAEKLEIDEMRFWFKLGMLLFDSGYYPESLTAFTYVPELASTNLYRFAGYTWMGHLKDLLKQRDEAMGYYREALKYESGDSMTHSQFRRRITRKWV